MMKKKGKIVTTLFDLFEAIHGELGAGEERLALPIFFHLIRAGRVKFIRNPRASRTL
jgi:hypothetical protein